MRRQFDRDLEAIEAKVIMLLGMVVEDLAVATQALLGGCAESSAVLAGREQLVDSLYVEVENLAAREILMQAPVASDLRFLLTVVRVVPELERSHDLLVQIASRAPRVRCEGFPPRAAGLTRRLADLASVMWRQAADAWYARDAATTASLSKLREEMSGLHAALTAEIATAPVTVLAAMEMALAARDYERLGAHALNLARRVAYLAGPSCSPPAPR
jgi:phosphate transport system protein